MNRSALENVDGIGEEEGGEENEDEDDGDCYDAILGENRL